MSEVEGAKMVDAQCDLKVLLCPIIWWEKHTCRKDAVSSQP